MSGYRGGFDSTGGPRRHDDEIPASSTVRPTCVRYYVLAALAAAAVTSYLTRVSLAPAASTIQAEMRIDDRAMGYVLSGFFIGYIVSQVPGGWLGDRFGARLALPLLSLLWSAAAIGSALSGSAATLWWSRFAMGLAQGGLFPISAKVITRWFPANRRGIASAVPTGFMSVGSVAASGLTVLLLPVVGWRGVFAIYSAAGIAWSIAFYLGFRDRPEEHPATNQAERKLILGGPLATTADLDEGPLPQKPAPPDQDEPEPTSAIEVVRAMATSPSLWAHCGQSFFRAFGYAFFVTWFPTYLERSRGVSIKNAGYLTMVPLAGVVLGSLLGGSLVDAVLTRTGNKWLSRSALSAGALGLCGLSMLAALLAADALLAVLVIATGSLLFGLTGPTAWAVTMDIGGTRTATVFAVMNMAGNLGAILCPVVVGYLIEYIQQSGGGWAPVLYLFAGIYFAAALCWLALRPERTIFERRAAPAAA
jgi:MFS family permease